MQLTSTLQAFSYGEAMMNTFLEDSMNASRKIVTRRIKVLAKPEEILKYINLPETYSSISDDDGNTWIFASNPPLKAKTYVIKIEPVDTSCDVRILGEEFAIELVLDSIIESPLEVLNSQIRWVYSAQGDSVSLPVSKDNLPREVFYASTQSQHGRNISDGLVAFWDEYLRSDSNVLLLIGPPGTGKTSFLRGLIHHSQSSALVTYDPTMLEQDGIFARFMSGSSRFMILEDCDAFLRKRSNGNTVMHKFLNIGDGLVSTRGKKLIFTTNLPSTADIDPALIRPGRCFDILKFAALSEEQCTRVAKFSRLDTVVDRPMTLAELFSGSTGKSVPVAGRPVGF
jgi:hypothetical protein